MLSPFSRYFYAVSNPRRTNPEEVRKCSMAEQIWSVHQNFTFANGFSVLRFVWGNDFSVRLGVWHLSGWVMTSSRINPPPPLGVPT